MYESTIRRSLAEKHHIQWQLDQMQSRRQKERPESMLFPLESSFSRRDDETADSRRYPRHGESGGSDTPRQSRNDGRRLEDAFSDAYATGRPGSTYGYNMFCGSSWAEASTSCAVRQNCPSGQSDECVLPGHECWAFTECDSRTGDGEQFAEMHDVVGAANLQASGVGAQASGGFVDLSRPSPEKSDHYFCGRGYEDAVSRCASHCPSGNLNDCPTGEICFFNTPCDARMMTRAPIPPSPTESPTTPMPVVYSSKLNKYFCGYDWDDAQERCEVWCPSGSDDDCPDDQLCFAFSKCHAVDMNGMTLAQMEKQKEEYQKLKEEYQQIASNSNNDATWWEPGSGGGAPRTPPPTGADEVPGYYDVMLGGTTRPTRNPTRRPTKRPVLSAEQAMHRYSFCGAFWTDARDNCETKNHCEDDRDCPEFEYCWTQTPCDYYATDTPTYSPTSGPTYSPTPEPTYPEPTQKPTASPIGYTPTRRPTPEPTWEPTFSPTYFPTVSPTITPEPTAKPTFDPNDPSLTFFCGLSWAHADETCGMRCPTGNSGDCPAEYECWAFTACDEERGIQTAGPTASPTPEPIVLTIPGPGGAQVPVFGGFDWSQFQPTKSPSPTASGVPSSDPSLPPGVVAKELLATYFCGKDWIDVERNCHQPCPGGDNSECIVPGHSCWAFVHSCKARTGKPTASPVTERPTPAPVVVTRRPTSAPATDPPTRDPDSPMTPGPTDPPTDLYDLLEGAKSKFYCAAMWDGIICGVSKACPSGDDTDCPSGQSCFSSEVDCSKPQPRPSDPPSYSPTRLPETSSAAMAKPAEPQSPPKNANGQQGQQDIDNEGEDWANEESVEPPSPPKNANGQQGQQDVDNEGEDWGNGGSNNDNGGKNIDNESEDWANDKEEDQQMIDNEGEDWDTVDDSKGGQQVDNEGEDWESRFGVDNDGEDWSQLETSSTTNLPLPGEPTLDPTPDPTIDLMEHLEYLKTLYFCSESWDNIDCANAKACPSGDSKDCPKRQQCFSGVPCKTKEEPSLPGKEELSEGGKSTNSRPIGPKDDSPSPTISTPLMGNKEDGSSGDLGAGSSANIVSETAAVDELTSKFFCGSSWGELAENCESAKPCPSGTNAECEGGQTCFADTPCGAAAPAPVLDKEVDTSVGIFNFAAMVNAIPPFCRDGETMSRNVGYWQSWSIYRDETCNPFTAESIDASSYTHIVFSFASISATGTLEPWDSEADIKGGQYQAFLDVKKKYPRTHAIIAVGGWTHNEPDNERLYRFSNAAATPRSRMKFAQSSVAFLRKYGFDGLDIDWEYPGDETRGGNATLDKPNLVLLCEELRKYFDDAPERYELSLAIPASTSRFDVGFDLANLAMSVHFFNVMAYDLHGTWDDPPVVGAHSDIGGINGAIDYMLDDGNVPPSQIVMGMAAYGRSYTIANDTCLSLGCKFMEDSNETAIGGCLDTNGFVPFVEIYNWEQKGEGKGYDSITVDLATYSAVMVKDGDQLISYDNIDTFRAKADYATNKCLGGTMVWAVDMMPPGTQGTGGDKGSGSGTDSGSGSNAGDDLTPEGILSEEDSVLAFCGKDWNDAISTCSTPCPSGLSEDCDQGEMCFAGTPCGEGGVIAAGETCKICPDSTSQGILSWVKVEVEIDGTVLQAACGDLDYGPLQSVTRESETCDKVKLDFSKECCFTYPQDQCQLCRKRQVYYNVRSEFNVTTPDGIEASCGLVNKMLAPEENGGERCVTTQDALFEECCYRQCSLCEGQGLKWWVEFDQLANRRGRETQENSEEEAFTKEDEEEEEATCSSIDASLYSDFVKAETEQCLDIKSQYSVDCCYTFPTNACHLCKQGDTTQTLLWDNEVEHEGQNVSCGVIDNILNTEEESSPTCAAAKTEYFSSCCFDKCSLCDNAQLAWDFVIDYYNDTTKTCGDVEAIFAADEVKSNSKECSSIRADYQDLCCFTPPVSPCTLCPEYVRWGEAVEVKGEEATCKEAAAMLKRKEEASDECSSEKENMGQTCCYELCDVCGEDLMLDWDAVVEYEDERIACGDFKPIFGRNEIEEGTEACSAVKETYQDYCCYTPPDIPCNLCQIETDFLEAYTYMEVDFWGSSMNCSDVYDYLIRRIESDSDTCSSAKNEISGQCCYKKCAICGGTQLQDFEQSIELKGDTISCQQLHTVRTSDIAVDSSDCQSMQSQFSNVCCYDAPETPCVLCAEGSVRKELEVDFGGETETCENVANFLANRINNGTEECTSSKVEIQQFCCFDKCSLCNDKEQIDWDAYVEFDGKEGVSCGSFDWHFTSNAIEQGTGQCTDLQAAFKDVCCYEPINYTTPACSLCKMGEAWYNLNGDAMVYFEGSAKTCTQVSNSLFRKAEDDSGFCDAAKAEYFASCCFEKCDICQGSQLDVNVEVAFNGTAATCLEVVTRFVTDIIMEGSEECTTSRELLWEPCCYLSPTDPCILCQSGVTSQGDVRDDVSVSFYGSTTTCFDLNSFLVSREEQVGFMCQAAKAELQEACCFQQCDVCGSTGNLYWDNPTTFNDITFACGELTWILSGNNIEEGSEECNQMQATYIDDCCSGPSALIPNAGNKCDICPSGKDWYAQVIYSEKPMTCLELDSVLLQRGVFNDSAECGQAVVDYSSQCCYIPPEKPCYLCRSGQKNAYSVLDQSVTFNGAETNCYGIYNYLWTRLETEDDACLATQNDIFDDCCYAKCNICQDYQLDQDAVVVHQGISMACSEIEHNFIGMNQIRRGSEQCERIQQEHWKSCCYDIPCDLCMSSDSKLDLLVDEPVVYMGVNRTCGDWSVLAESELSQSDACKSTKNVLFKKCCFKECNLCEDPGSSINWNYPLNYGGLASTCLDVYMYLRSERVQDGDDQCKSIQFSVSRQCCHKMPTNQCSLCQSSNGTFLNTNWNSEVKYRGETVTCGDVNAMLSSEELDSIRCLSARDDFWIQCCTPQQGGNTGLGGILPAPPLEVFDGDESGQSGWNPTTENSYNEGWNPTTENSYNDGGFAGTFFRQNTSSNLHSLHSLVVQFVGFLTAIITLTT